MKISNEHVSVAETPPSKTKSIIIWTISIIALLSLGVGLGAFMSNYDAPPVDAGGETSTTTGEIPVEDVPDENVIKQADIEHAVDEALSEQAVTYQEKIDTLEEKLSQFEQDDIEAYQIQVEDLRKEIDTLREANEELKDANHTLSENNAELTERTTVTEVKEAYEAQIKKLEADNKELENLLQHVKQRLEDGQ